MNFLFILPKCVVIQAYGYQRPGAAYVASSLKNYGYPVFGLELTYIKDEFLAIEESIIKNNIDAVCLGILATDYNDVKKIITFAKRIKPTVKIILGGAMLSTNTELIMNSLPVDFGVIGQGEQTICELADALKNAGDFHESEDFHKIEGLIFRDKTNPDKFIKTPPRKDFTNIDNLPFPCYEMFDVEHSIEEHGSITIIASRSCPYSCTFCYHPDSKYVQRSLDSLFQEVDYWLKKYKSIKHIHFLDDLFSTDRGRVIEFCRKIKKYNITYQTCFRVDDVTADILKELHDSGCQNICYGLESADNRILKSMRKNITIEQIETALEMTYDAGIGIEGYFLFGDVEETFETATNTINWWLEHLHYKILLVHLRVFPGSELYKYAVGNGFIKDELKHLEDGCPVINISKLCENDFLEISNKISRSVLFFNHTSLLVIDSKTEEGKYSGRAECFKCGTVNIFKNRDAHANKYMACSGCNTPLYFSPSQAENFASIENNQENRLAGQHKSLINSATEMLFKEYANKKVVIWGGGVRTQILLENSEELRKCVVKIVDSNFAEFENKKILKMPIEDPKVLKDDDFDCILVTVVSKKDDVIDTIKNKFALPTEILTI